MKVAFNFRDKSTAATFIDDLLDNGYAVESSYLVKELAAYRDECTGIRVNLRTKVIQGIMTTECYTQQSGFGLDYIFEDVQ